MTKLNHWPYILSLWVLASAFCICFYYLIDSKYELSFIKKENKELKQINAEQNEINNKNILSLKNYQVMYDSLKYFCKHPLLLTSQNQLMLCLQDTLKKQQQEK